MSFTQRGKRRLLLVFIALVLIGASIAALRALRSASRARLAQESRAAGLAAYREGDYETALSKLSYYISGEKADLEALLAFADSRLNIPETNNRHLIKAAAYYDAALRVAPENTEALSELLDIYRRIRYRAEAEDTADRLLALLPDHIDSLAVKAEIAFFEEDYDEAIELYGRLSDREPQDLEWRHGHIRALEASNTPRARILDLCDEWIEHCEQDGRFRLLKTHVLADFGEIDAAKAEIAKGIELETSSPEILQAMLSALDALDMRDEAEGFLDRAKSTTPGQRWVYEAAIRRLWQSFRHTEALAELDEAERALGKLDTRLGCWKALILAERGDLESAAGAVKAIDAQLPQTEAEDRRAAEAWSAAIKARLHAETGQWARVFEGHNRSAMLGPDDPVLRFLHARAYQQIGEHGSALLVLRQLARAYTTWTSLNVALAQSLLALGQATEAFETVSRIVARAPESGGNIYLLLCRAWLALGPAGDAIRMTDSDGREYDLLDLLESIHAQVGWHAQGTALLLEAYWRRGMSEQAASLLDDAEADEQTDPVVLLALAEASAAWDAHRAPALIDAAASRGGATAEVMMARARLLLRSGKTEESIAALDDALTVEASDPEQRPQIALLRAQVLLERGTDAAESEVVRLVQAGRSPRTALALLAREDIWNHRTVARAALNRLGDLLGADALRIRLEEARYLWRFEADDPAAIARAQAMVQDVLRIDPQSKAALTLMASLQLVGDEARPAKAIENLRRALDLYPAETSLYPHLVRLLQQQGDFATARDYLARMGRHVGQDLDLRRVEVDLLESQGEYDRAIERLRTLLELDPSEGNHLHLASLLTRAGRRAQAEETYFQLLSQGDLSEDLVIAAAFHQARMGRAEEGRALLESGLSGRDESVRSLQLGRFLFRQGLYEEAEQYLIAALQLEPDSVQIREELTSLYAVSGDLEKALRFAAEGLTLDPGNSGLKRAVVAIAVSSEQPIRSQLITDLNAAALDDPVFMQVVNLCGHSSDPGDSDLDRARQLVEEHPQRPEAWLAAISLHARAGEWEEAIRLARQGSGRLPTDPTPARIATSLLSEVDRYDEALDMARIWRQRTLDAPFHADTSIAALLLDLDRPAEAVNQLAIYADHLWTHRDRYPPHLAVWLGALIQAGDSEKAGTLIPTLLEEDEHWRKDLLNMTQRLDRQPAEALLQILDPILSQSPSDRLHLAIAWTNYATRFNAHSAYARADDLAESIEENPDLSFSAVALRANIAVGLGDLETAERLYRSLYAQRDHDVLVLNNLAHVLIQGGTRCEEAVMLAQRAVQLEENDSRYLDTLARALLCAGLTQEAEWHIRQALIRQPQKPCLLITLAEVLHAAGKDSEATREFERAASGFAASQMRDTELELRLKKLRDQLNIRSSNSRTPIRPNEATIAYLTHAGLSPTTCRLLDRHYRIWRPKSDSGTVGLLIDSLSSP